ncbi:lymphocyte antigen 6E-like isoform X2 [Rhinatrema bivittatum]|uniref:lymphocyte antigen 6E-like isoform X2 n=1 Tax=Rhinatrema bivittatum TaxID=194408 RepID=UPI00112E484C|nr:lymphocyte antigen 6E-like isoform X2 [Rhinatrema bivittatum]
MGTGGTDKSNLPDERSSKRKGKREDKRRQEVCSLTCYTCLNESSNSKCLTPTNCSDSDTYCRTSVQRAGFGALSYVSITKACASFCTESNVNSAFVGYSVSCCRADLCNVSGATSEKTSFLVLLASAGFIVTLLRAGL